MVHVDDAGERAKRKIGRPSTVANFRKQVVEILQETPDLASLEILRRVRQTGYSGGKTALYALVASLRSKPTKPLVRFEGLPGEFSQHDSSIKRRVPGCSNASAIASASPSSRWESATTDVLRGGFRAVPTRARLLLPRRRPDGRARPQTS